ncbi:hypothetical protein ACFO1B_42205 [Dactylosporangium siamense]|uniref:DUF1453 domain-containing protein n=1 Tax=Dactylosporangium siamense TaxID=685454 RepID=A0A919PXG2_9ACTN|nr:hypothetical protein [Dactylosporangium siamense]GIG51036.1 hypothetical protein Dsi01nite_090770 [Dactylosporangium siamense]
MVQQVLVVAAAVAFAGFVISRQVRRRKVTVRGLVILPVWFLVLSLLVDHAMIGRLHTGATVGFFAAGIAFAGVMGALRFRTLRVWRGEDGPWCEGNWRTGALWVATIAVRVGLFLLATRLGATEGAGEAMVYVAVTLGVQNLLLANATGLLPNAAPAAAPLERVG